MEKYIEKEHTNRPPLLTVLSSCRCNARAPKLLSFRPKYLFSPRFSTFSWQTKPTSTVRRFSLPFLLDYYCHAVAITNNASVLSLLNRLSALCISIWTPPGHRISIPKTTADTLPALSSPKPPFVTANHPNSNKLVSSQYHSTGSPQLKKKKQSSAIASSSINKT